jgi:hypothetical protein
VTKRLLSSFGTSKNNLLLLFSILLHSALDPFATLGSVLLHLVLVFEKLLDGVRVGYMASLFNTGTGGHALFPGFE